MQFKLQLNTTKHDYKPASHTFWDASEMNTPMNEVEDSNTFATSHFPFKPVIVHRNLKSSQTTKSSVPRVGEVRYLDVFNYETGRELAHN